VTCRLGRVNADMTCRLVLDTNCIIDLEENRPDAFHLRKLIAAWKQGRLQLATVAVSASENQRTGFASPDFGEFEAKLASAGLAGVHHLLPPMVWDFFYWDHALWTSTEMAELESRIRDVLFPGIQPSPPTDPNENSVWRNRMCDVLAAWSCVHHKWECLVTRDGNFHDHKVELAALGLRELQYPADAAAACEI